MTKVLDAHSQAYVGIVPSIMTPGTGTIYVIIDDRAAFDLLDLPMTDHGPKPTGHVLSKVIDGACWYIIFQHWIKHAAELHQSNLSPEERKRILGE